MKGFNTELPSGKEIGIFLFNGHQKAGKKCILLTVAPAAFVVSSILVIGILLSYKPGFFPQPQSLANLQLQQELLVRRS